MPPTNKKAIKKASQYSPIADIKIREEVLTISQLYDYLHACDALILNKTYQPHVVISAIVLQCLGSGCPIIARDSNAVETLHKEILKFESENEFGDCLIDVLERGEKYKQTVQSAKEYVKKNSAGEVAKQFIELFEFLL